MEPQARESLLSPIPSKPSIPTGETSILSPSKASSSTLTVDTFADNALEDGLSSAALSSAGFTSLPHVKAVSVAFLERTPFAIDDVGDDEDDSDLDLVHGEDDTQVMDEVSCGYIDIRNADPLLAQVDAFLEANDSGLSEADKEVAKGAYMFFIGPPFPQRRHAHHQFQISLMRSRCDKYIIGRVHDHRIVNHSTCIIITLLYFWSWYCPLDEDIHSIIYIANQDAIPHKAKLHAQKVVHT